MEFGLHALGIGSGASPEVIRSVSAAAEAVGFARLWCGEHVVMVDRPASRYPYSDDGRIAVPADADWLDPLLALTFAAAATVRIGLATGVLLLPQHNPLIAAKQLATLDVLSGGRLTAGVGIGWSAEEFAALGIPFSRRGERAVEYVAALRALWSQEVASFAGKFASFEGVRLYPKPAGGRQIPVVLGGNSDAALRRVAEHADGWYGFSLTVAQAEERIGVLSRLCRQHGRDPGSLTIAVALTDYDRVMLADLGRIGVTEVVRVAAPPQSAGDAAAWVAGMAAASGLTAEPGPTAEPGL